MSKPGANHIAGDREAGIEDQRVPEAGEMNCGAAGAGYRSGIGDADIARVEINPGRARNRAGIGDPAAERQSLEIDPFAECGAERSAIVDAARKLRGKNVESGFLGLNGAGVGDAA